MWILHPHSTPKGYYKLATAPATSTRKKRVPLTPDQKILLLKKLASSRVSRAIKAIRAVAQLSRLAPTDKQVTAMVEAMQAELNTAQKVLSSPSSAPANAFTLPA